jgi:hypothetical protein
MIPSTPGPVIGIIERYAVHICGIAVVIVYVVSRSACKIWQMILEMIAALIMNWRLFKTELLPGVRVVRNIIPPSANLLPRPKDDE